MPKSPLKVELLLRSRLIKEALSTVLTVTKFSVLRERDEYDDHATVTIDVDDCRNPEVVGAHRQKGDNIVVLASGADALEVDDDQIASLSGILTYDLSLEAFVQSLRLICSGERVFPRDVVARRKLPGPSPAIGPRSDGDRLSPREREVLAHLLEGHANKVIARLLGMAEATVKVQIMNLLRKIKVDNRTQAVIWAMHNLSELKAATRSFVCDARTRI